MYRFAFFCLFVFWEGVIGVTCGGAWNIKSVTEKLANSLLIWILERGIGTGLGFFVVHLRPSGYDGKLQAWACPSSWIGLSLSKGTALRFGGGGGGRYQIQLPHPTTYACSSGKLASDAYSQMPRLPPFYHGATHKLQLKLPHEPRPPRTPG